MQINERWLSDHGLTQADIDGGRHPGPLIAGGFFHKGLATNLRKARDRAAQNLREKPETLLLGPLTAPVVAAGAVLPSKQEVQTDIAKEEQQAAAELRRQREQSGQDFREENKDILSPGDAPQSDIALGKLLENQSTANDLSARLEARRKRRQAAAGFSFSDTILGGRAGIDTILGGSSAPFSTG